MATRNITHKDILIARYKELKDLCIMHETNQDTNALRLTQERMYELEHIAYYFSINIK